MEQPETGVSMPGGVTAIPRGSVRLGAGAPEPTRPGNEIRALETTRPGTPEWIFSDIHLWQDQLYQKDMKQHRVDNPKWRAGPYTEAFENASQDRLIRYAKFKKERIANQKLPTIHEA